MSTQSRAWFRKVSRTCCHPCLLLLPLLLVGALSVDAVPPRVDVYPYVRVDATLTKPTGNETIHLLGVLETETEVGPIGEADDSTANGLDESLLTGTYLFLKGNSSLGVITLRLNPLKPTKGFVEEQANVNFGVLDTPPFAPTGTLSVVMELFLEVELPEFTLHNKDAIPLGGTSAGLPLDADATFTAAASTPLLNVLGEYDGYALGGITVYTRQHNETCATAAPITTGMSVEGTNLYSTSSVDETTCTYKDIAAVWYLLVPQSSGVCIIDLCSTSELFDTSLAVFSGCSIELACNDDSCGTFSRISLPVQRSHGYLIRVAGYDGSVGSFTLSVATPTPPANDQCSTPGTLTAGAPVTGYNLGATGPDAEDCGTLDLKDVWYRYLAPQTGVVNISLCDGTTFDTTLSVYDACGGDLLVCNDDACSIYSEAKIAVSAGQDYLVRVAGFYGAEGFFTINLTETPGLSLLQGTVRSAGQDDASSLAVAGATLRVSQGGTEVGVVTSRSGGLYQFAGPAAEDYSLIVTAPWQEGASLTDIPIALGHATRQDVLLRASGHDYCNLAPQILEDEPRTGHTAGATGIDESSCGIQDMNDVWWKYTPTDSGVATFSTGCGTATDLIMSLFDVCGGTELACSDDTCGYSPEISYDVTVGTTYLIRLSGVLGSFEPYTLLATLEPTPEGEGGGEGEGAIEGEPWIWDCDADALYGQAPSPLASGDTRVSGTATVYQFYEYVSGVSGDVGGVRYWGSYGCAGSNSYQIQFYADNAGKPGTLLRNETITPQAVDTGEVLFGTLPIYMFEARLATPLSMTAGWVSIYSLDPACSWGWYVSSEGDDQVAVRQNATYTEDTFNLSFCLLPPEAEGEGEPWPVDVLTADRNRDQVISLAELLRGIQFYNSLGLHCATPPASTEDGYDAGPGTDHACTPHDTDYAPTDWTITLTELLRLVQFYNAFSYHYCPGMGSEDEFCTGPA